MLPARQVLTILSAITLFACHSRQPADLILYHGKVYTVDSLFDTAEAFAIRDGKILAVGTDREIRGLYISSNEIDAGGKSDRTRCRLGIAYLIPPKQFP